MLGTRVVLRDIYTRDGNHGNGNRILFTSNRGDNAKSSGFLWLLHRLEAAVVLGGVKHSDSLQQPHLRLLVTLTILPLLCRLPVGPENAETVLDHRIRANPQFSVIRRKRHVARTERGNRKSTKKRTRIKTSGIRHHTAPAGMPGNFWGQLPCRIPRSSLCFSSPIRIMRLKS